MTIGMISAFPSSGIEAFKQGLVFEDRKRLRSEAASRDQEAKKKRKVYLWSLKKRNLTLKRLPKTYQATSCVPILNPCARTRWWSRGWCQTLVHGESECASKWWIVFVLLVTPPSQCSLQHKVPKWRFQVSTRWRYCSQRGKTSYVMQSKDVAQKWLPLCLLPYVNVQLSINDCCWHWFLLILMQIHFDIPLKDIHWKQQLEVGCQCHHTGGPIESWYQCKLCRIPERFAPGHKCQGL